MAREITVPEVNDILYKICPKCNDNHKECDKNCSWYHVENPCTIIHSSYDFMVVRKTFHDGWRIKDLEMIGEKYFLTQDEAQKEIGRIKADK